jgi:hypothetical protein
MGLLPSSYQLSEEDQSKLGLGTTWTHQIQMARVGFIDAMEKKAEVDAAIENLRAQPEVRSLLVGRLSAFPAFAFVARFFKVQQSFEAWMLEFFP